MVDCVQTAAGHIAMITVIELVGLSMLCRDASWACDVVAEVIRGIGGRCGNPSTIAHIVSLVR